MDKPLIDGSAMYRSLLDAGTEWADSKAAYQALDDATKSVLADITGDYRTAETSRAEAETMALRSQKYRDHLASVAAARRDYLRAEVRYDALRTLVELRRSEESTRRAEMRL